jgi:hypothetical protein
LVERSQARFLRNGRFPKSPSLIASYIEYNFGMRHTLRRHPDSLCVAATRIDVEIGRPRPGSLVLSYIVSGKISELRMPPIVAAARADELWRHTCFEAFVRPAAGPEYYEFNLSPSTRWAAYGFSGYRRGMRVATEIGAPRIEVRSSAASYSLQAALELDRLSPPWRLGLSAVLEETNGRKSYWALAHPPGKADFHHADCFALELS